MDTRSVNPPPSVFKTVRRQLNTVLLLTLPLGFSLGVARAQELIYTEVRTAQPVVAVGEELNLEVVLLNAFSEPIAAPEAYDLSVEVYRDSSTGELFGTHDVAIPVGETSASLTLPIAERGTFSVVATHPALVSRELFVQVYDPEGNLPRTPASAPLRFLGFVHASPAPPVTEAVIGAYKLKISYQADVPYRANEGDRVRVQFFLTDEAGNPARAAENIEISLGTQGRLMPERIVIAEGNFSTTAFLRSDRAGLVDIAYLGSSPDVQLAEGTVLEPVRFIYTGLHIDPGPKASLIQPATLTIQLLGRDGKPVKAEADRKVTVGMLAGSRGNGVFKPLETTIKKDDFEGKVTLFPTWPGRINVRASSAGVANVVSAVEVSSALLWIFVALAGGVLGALAAFINEVPPSEGTPSPRLIRVLKRVFVGVIAGSLLYWAYLFGVLLPPSPNLILLHPFTAFFVNLLGAFVGIRVLTLLVRRFVPGT